MKSVVGMKRILLLVYICIFLASCGQNIVTVIEDLSVASPVEVQDFSTSYVKIVETNQSHVETTEPTIEETNELEKKVYREGDLIEFDPIGTDPDGDIITYSYSRPLNNDGQWQTEIGDAGTYLVTITASDGKTEAEKKLVLLILSANRAPSIDNLNDMVIAEGDLITLKPKIFDYNSDEVQVEYSKPFNENGEWQTGYEDSGTYVVKITASDLITTTEKQITIVVEDKNRAPVLKLLNDMSMYAGDFVEITPEAEDPDGDAVTYSFSSPLSSGGTWQSSEEDEGIYTIKVTASDGKSETTEDVQVTLNHKNKAPVITLSPVTAQETELVTLQPTITDTEGDEFVLTYSKPFNENSEWQTGYEDSGMYAVIITATDSNGAVSTLEVTVTITDKNRAPVFKI